MSPGAADADEPIVKLQTLTYNGSNFGAHMVASGQWFAAVANQAPSGGTFDVPFPGECCPAAVYRWTGGLWEEDSLLYRDLLESRSGVRVDLSGSRIVHGVSQVATSAGLNAGRVFTYLADPDWRFEAEVMNPEPGATTYFGWDVELEGDTLAVLAMAGTTSIYVYRFQSDEWKHTLTLRAPGAFEIAMNGGWIAANKVTGDGVVLYRANGDDWEVTQTIQPPAGEAFGGSLALVGRTLVVGSPHVAIGKVHVYGVMGEQWSLSQQLDASDRIECTYFGENVALTREKMIVGAPYACVNGMQSAGLARLYRRIDGSWVQIAQFLDETPAQNENFGQGVAVSAEHAYISGGMSETNFTLFKVDVYTVPKDQPQRRRPVRRR
jgi:hypothetical protein